MACNVFIDSDVILDVLLKREDFYKESYGIFILCEQEEVILYTSSSIILNVQYVGEKISSKNAVAKTIYYLIENFIEVINPTKQTILKAYDFDFKYYEMQYNISLLKIPA